MATGASESGFDDPPRLSVVVPVYQEAECLGELYRRLSEAMEGVGAVEFVVVEDGSRDGTPEILRGLAERDGRVRAVFLTRNFGHQAAVSAGLDHARGDAVVVMDADLQDPPELIPRMIALWEQGAEVVYGVRASRKGAVWKRWAYAGFYRLLRRISEVEIPLDSGDFCLMDRSVVEVLRHLPERLRFLRGLRSFVGFRQIPLEYDRPERVAGRSKYSLTALVRLAVDGLVSFSSAPLRLVTYLGLVSAVLAAGLAGWVFWDAVSTRSAPRGWASTIVVVLFMSAVQMINQGIMGAYIRRIFVEVKQRPTYLVRPTEEVSARRSRVDRGGPAVPRASSGRVRGAVSGLDADRRP
jgi:dolichol-phosphate mannosyltransferase